MRITTKSPSYYLPSQGCLESAPRTQEAYIPPTGWISHQPEPFEEVEMVFKPHTDVHQVHLSDDA